MTSATENAKQMETYAAEARESVSEQMERMSKTFEDLAAFNQASMDAMMKAANAAVKSAEEINGELMSYSKKSMEESVAAAKDMAASRSLMELMETQSAFARTWMDGMMKQTARLNELAMTGAREAGEPLTERMTAAADLARPRAESAA
jgi:phasin family protein